MEEEKSLPEEVEKETITDPLRLLELFDPTLENGPQQLAAVIGGHKELEQQGLGNHEENISAIGEANEIMTTQLKYLKDISRRVAQREPVEVNIFRSNQGRDRDYIILPQEPTPLYQPQPESK